MARGITKAAATTRATAAATPTIRFLTPHLFVDSRLLPAVARPLRQPGIFGAASGPQPRPTTVIEVGGGCAGAGRPIRVRLRASRRRPNTAGALVGVAPTVQQQTEWRLAPETRPQTRRAGRAGLQVGAAIAPAG